MNIIVQSIRFDADRKLIKFIQKKVNKLDQFFDQIIDGECYLKLENVEDEANKVTEFKLNIPGNQLFAKAQAKSFEEATDSAVESLRRQINKHKTKTRTKASNHKALLSLTEVRVA
ncbi:ribosome hibernation-promoting factor, HPF/YfiA family [Parapedobacter koreensis]|uniref:Putative sigma-54 modulation protein n=1 Tax=Parapedobacter koreensis TaxID=332977 RepID=A0A1H7TWS0_9SPHI|nr:ribosome-associated translation inhibitor RaiA [Parapedobacter koreensis]SEL88397.1 putative sigma-54 modulation protein [Parapedobacter koreensis]